MMRKRLLAIALTLFIVPTSAQTLQEFEYGGIAEELDEGSSVSLAGGESFSGTLSFENVASGSRPGVFELVLSSDDLVVEGPELDVSASVNGKDVTCRTSSLSNTSVAYRCFNSSENELVEGLNGINFSASVNPRTAPDRYELALSVRSSVGEGQVVGEENVSANETVEIESQDVSVEVNSSSNASVEVKELEDVSASPPEDGGFAGGVSVDVSNGSGDVEASGSVSIRYEDDSLDDRDLEVYFYNDSRSTDRWQGVGGRQFPDNNTVVAEVDHFSTYAAFSTEEDESETEDDSDSSSIDLDLQEEDAGEDSGDNDSRQETPPREDSELSPGEDLKNTSDESNDSGEGAAGSEPDLPGSVEIGGGDESSTTGPTGRFFAGRTPLIVSALLILAGLVLYLKREYVLGLVGSFRSRFV